MKQKLFILLLVFFTILGSGIVFAQDLETQYPTLPGGLKLSLHPTLPEFILYVYYFLLAVSGFIAIASLVAGGIQYMVSGGNVASQTEARKRVSGAVLGILVLLGSSLILGTINPSLRILRFEKTTPSIQSQKCECANPTTDICKKVCEPKKTIGAEALEIPVGNLIERILKESTLSQFASIAQQAEKLSFAAKEAARKYGEELGACSCSRKEVIPQCGGSSCPAPPLACTGEPCDKAALAQKKKALEDANTALTQYIETNIGTNVSLSSGMAPGSSGTPISGGSCAAGTGACSPSALSAFGSKAGEASQICQKESGGNVRSLNDGCLRSDYDYSVGLFQINLYRTGRCPGAFREIDAKTCEIIDHGILEACMEKYGFGDADKNIQGALGISGGGNNWCPWTASFPQHCNLCEK